MHPILFLVGVSPGLYPRTYLSQTASRGHLATFVGLRVLGISHGPLYEHNLQISTSNNAPKEGNYKNHLNYNDMVLTKLKITNTQATVANMNMISTFST